jgi:hypothetical protein
LLLKEFEAMLLSISIAFDIPGKNFFIYFDEPFSGV